MKVVFTEAALADLDAILAYTSQDFPSVAGQLQQRLLESVERIGRWPEAARRLEGNRDIRVVPLVRFPFKIFYRVVGDHVELLHIHHAARSDPGLD